MHCGASPAQGFKVLCLLPKCKHIFCLVRPGPPENLKLQALPSNSLQLTFTIPRPLVHFPIGLIYLVNYKSSWDEKWTSMEPEVTKDKQEVTYNLENLEYGWTEYSVEVITH